MAGADLIHAGFLIFAQDLDRIMHPLTDLALHTESRQGTHDAYVFATDCDYPSRFTLARRTSSDELDRRDRLPALRLEWRFLVERRL